MSNYLKVGELAERTGISVRTLHHYESLGLLVPSHRTASNHRLYMPADVARLAEVMSLRGLGLPLERIGELLASKKTSALSTVERHLAAMREAAELQARMIERLEGLARILGRGEEASVEELLLLIEVMTSWEDKFSATQLEEIRARGRAMGPEKIREIEEAWMTLLASLRAAMEGGVDPKSPEVQAMTAKMREYTRMFSGGNAAIESTMKEAYQRGAGAHFGVDAAMIDYLARAGM